MLKQKLGVAVAALARRPAWALLFAWCVLSLPWLTGLKAIPFDSAQQFYPAVAFTVQQLHALEAPWWNPYLFGGYPQFADPQMMTFQPTVVLPMLLSPQPSLWWFDVVVLLHVLAAGLGCLRLGRSYGLRAAPQLLFALTFMYGAVAASRLQHTPMIVSYALLPWIWWALRRLDAQLRWPQALLLGALGGLCALQLTQLTYLMALLAAAYALGQVAYRRDGRRLRHAGLLALAAALALAISAPQWLSTLAFLPYSNRAQLPLSAALAGSMQVPTLTTLLAGNFLSHGYGKYWGSGDLSQDYFYLGSVPLLIWTLWGGAAARQHRREVRWLLAVFALSVLYALGTRLPLYGALHAVLPGMDFFRRPGDAQFLAVPMAALLAAFALQSRLDGARRSPHWPTVVALAALLVYGLLHAVGAHRLGSALAALLVTAIFSAAAWRALRTPSRRGLAALLVLLALDLLVHNVGQRFNAGSLRNRVLVAGATGEPRTSAHAGFRVMERELAASGIPERAEVFGLSALSNGAMVHRLALASGYNPLLYARYAEVSGTSPEPLASLAQRRFTAWAPDYHAAVFDLLGVRLLLSGEPFDGATATDGVYFGTRGTVLPRVLNPHEVHRHPQPLPPASDYVRTEFRTTLWLPSRAPASSCPEHGAGKADIESIRYRPNRVEIRYRADAPAWLVVNELDAPGWGAQVDGEPVPLHAGNAMFRAVCVKPGAHALVLAFDPWTMIRAGLARKGWTLQR